MKKVIKKIKAWYSSFLDMYKSRKVSGMVLLSVLLVLGFLWPLFGFIVFICSRFRKQYHDYGVMAMIGVALNLITYLIQIMIRVVQQMG